MSVKKKTIKPLPFPTMGRPEYVPGSNRAKMQGSGGEHMHKWLRESERELLYGTLSKLFPDPDNQPDWYASHIPFALMVAAGYAPQNFTAEPGQLAGNFPYGLSRLKICLFYNRYVVPRMEGKMSPRYLPPECLSEEERKIRDFSIQTMVEWLPDDRQAGDSLTESNTKLSARLNDAGAREVDGRRFSPSSAGAFRGRHVLDAEGAPRDYDKFRPEEWKAISVEQWMAEYYGLVEIRTPDAEVTSELPEEVEVDEELAEEDRNMRKPKDVKATGKRATKSQGSTGTTKKQGKETAKKMTVQKTLAKEADGTADNKLVEEAVAFINEKANEALYKYSIEIGNYLLDKFFDGDIAAASSRNPRKFTSYRALCKHPDLGPSPGALSVMLRVAAQEKLFESNKLPVEKLSYSHKAELVTVFDDQTKVDLFKEAVKKSLTVRQLQDRVREKKGLVPSIQLGQGVDGHVARFNFEALLKTKALADPEALKTLPEKKRNELKERVEGAYTILARLLEEYGRLKDLFAELEK